MDSNSYNKKEKTISRLDQLLNRNQQIYQNLKIKLDGINKSNQNIYKNISHINSNYNEINSHQSSAIQKQYLPRPPIPNLPLVEQDNEHTYTIRSDSPKNNYIPPSMSDTLKSSKQKHHLQLYKQYQKNELKQQKQKHRKYTQIYDTYKEQPTPHFDRQSVKSFKRNPIFKQQKYSPQNIKNTTKDNSIYLKQIPKQTNPTQVQDSGYQQAMTFRQIQEKQLEQKLKIKQQLLYQEQTETFPRRKIQTERQYLYEPKQSSVSKRSSNSQKYKYNINPNISSIQNTQRNHQKKENSSHKLDDIFAKTPFSRTIRKLALSESCINPAQNNIHQTTYLFIPFNKIYRSPIMQIRPGGQIILQRKSRTPSSNAGKLVDGFKYKLNTIVNDQQNLLKLLFFGKQNFNIQDVTSSKIAILGGRETLKKKIHMGLFAYITQFLQKNLSQAQEYLKIQLQYQFVSDGQPRTISSKIQKATGNNNGKLAIMQLQRAGEDILAAIKQWGKGTTSKTLKMTKVNLYNEQQQIWSFMIISCNPQPNHKEQVDNN